MRLNKFIAQASNYSRRAADKLIEHGRVSVNDKTAFIGQEVASADKVSIDEKPLNTSPDIKTIILNKPVGYVCSKKGQGSKTIYDLLPDEFKNLNPVGRLDKESSGIILLTNDGKLANQLTHPSFEKEKVYELEIDKPINRDDIKKIAQTGVQLEDGISKFNVGLKTPKQLTVKMHEGRNRQIRRTFNKLGYRVNKLNRTKFGGYELNNLAVGEFK